MYIYITELGNLQFSYSYRVQVILTSGLFCNYWTLWICWKKLNCDRSLAPLQSHDKKFEPNRICDHTHPSLLPRHLVAEIPVPISIVNGGLLVGKIASIMRVQNMKYSISNIWIKDISFLSYRKGLLRTFHVKSNKILI